jgi:hypothetical protein
VKRLARPTAATISSCLPLTTLIWRLFFHSILTSLLIALAPSPSARAADVTIDNHIDLDATNTTPGDDLIVLANPDFSPFVNLHAGAIIHNVQSFDDSIFEILGGVIKADAMAYESSLIDLHSGAVQDDLRAFDDAVIFVFGGSVGPGAVVASNSSVINISGGEILSDLQAHDSAIIQVFGSGLTLSGGLLTGTLQDGTPISRNVVTTGDGLILMHNVPEPSSFLGLAIAVAVIGGCARLRLFAPLCIKP